MSPLKVLGRGYAVARNEAGQVLTASGRGVCIGEAVAVDPDIIPLGSTVTIGGKE